MRTSMQTPCSTRWSNRSGSKGRPTWRTTPWGIVDGYEGAAVHVLHTPEASEHQNSSSCMTLERPLS